MINLIKRRRVACRFLVILPKKLVDVTCDISDWTRNPLDPDVASTFSVVGMQANSSRPVERYSIQQVAKAASVTSRTLRHYDHIGLLEPVEVSTAGYRLYDQASIVRLQRILLLRNMGMELKAIGAILDQEQDQIAALTEHIEVLKGQRAALDRQLETLQKTIERLNRGESMDLNESFEGINEQYRKEVIERWGEESYTASDRWWKALSADERGDFMAQSKALIAAWTNAGTRGLSPDSAEAQQLAAEHVRWLRGIPGTPGHGSDDPSVLHRYVRNLAEMYVADQRFGDTYGGQAQFVHDALIHHLDQQ